ncbi:flagellar hook protein FlgE [Roseivivax sp. GX 12232]|uniref:flagellar hook protein FlgE n=1 Tax=Roseivivax sp. GX 12232 TaxID=2900547 RepID=UPI001E2DEBAB|nr:flagellar hook protein FlgE [Roseivivax sp. GX 12232]MCE0503890.1 flagellar hook protein FlgE [Roseivivax sp. GX 12232]
MSISQSMQIGVSGLNANAERVGDISNNIANASTDGYKRSFSSMVSETVGSDQTAEGAGVRAEQRHDISTTGAVRGTTSATDLAIEGSGFFVVSENADEANQANYALTRAGSFSPDDEGNLVNAAGYYLAGFPVDESGAIGAVDTNSYSDLETVNIGDQTIAGQATSAIDVRANLPSQATGLATPGDPFISSVEYFTPLGEAERMSVAFAPSGTENLWTMTFSDNEGAVLGSADVTFNDSGANAGSPASYTNVQNLATAPAAFAFDAATGTATVTLDTGATPQDVEITLGAPDAYGGLTQFAGDYSGLTISSDGASAGTLVSADIDADGMVYGVFDNGARKALYQIPLADVANPDGLAPGDGNTYKISLSSGPLNLLFSGGGAVGPISAFALESSNVNVAQELTDLIQVQRAYSSNAKIVTTTDQMLEETLQIKR